MSKIIWIGCGKAKAVVPCAAAELYTGSLFRVRCMYAEQSGWPWWIVSAKYGLLAPDVPVSPYDLRLRDLPEVDRAAWYLGTVGMLLDEMNDTTRLREVHVELHIGADYAERLSEVLLAAGLNYSWPLKGFSQGEQMRWYKQKRESVLKGRS